MTANPTNPNDWTPDDTRALLIALGVGCGIALFVLTAVRTIWLHLPTL